MLRSASLILLLLICGVFKISAQTDTETIKLTNTDVDQFINGFPVIQRELQALDINYMQDDHQLTMPEGAEILSKVNSIVQKQGYDDYADFLLKAGTIINAYLAVEMGRESGSIQPEIQESIREIEKNPYYTEEQKKQMKDALIQSSKAMEEYSKSASTDENISVVKPYTSQIKQIIEAGDN
jgi:predicted RNA-binding protein with EMAP domain